MSNKHIDADAVWQETAASEKALVAAAATAEQIEMNQLLGRLQATQAIAAMLDGLSLAQIAQIKEGKRYKQLAGQKMVIGGAEIRLDTWEGFCAALGSSRRAIEEKLDNLRLLGAEALDKATALGMTTQELTNRKDLMLQLSPVEKAFIFMMQNLIAGFVMSLPIALVCRRSK